MRDRIPAATAGGRQLQFLPLRFERWDDGRVLLTNMVGEHLFVDGPEFEALSQRRLTDPALIRRLRAKHLVRLPGEQLPVDLLAVKYRTQHQRLADSTSLHLFVVTLRCEHSCAYCQVSRRNLAHTGFDMTPETARAAVSMAFRSPSPRLKFEFQGGEPLLNMPAVRLVVEEAERINGTEGRRLAFVIASNLALLDDEVLAFAQRHDVSFSTSLDGPEDLHNRNRPRPGRDSRQRTLTAVAHIREQLGHDRVSALMTTTAGSLGRVREIIDSYLENGFRHIFLRPVSPYGFARRLSRRRAYDVDAWADFYTEGMEYILELNARGVPVVETYSAIVLKKMLTNDSPGYVDLTSPAGIGIGALVYNYDGAVYASDEGRMLAESGDFTFRLGQLGQDSYADLMTSAALLDPLEESYTGSVPMCCDCAFERYCGADPVFHHTTAGDPVGRKPESAFCRRNKAVFRFLLDRYTSDPHARELFRAWAAR
ncbi:His-Xaa-Ser system radical SAM maturase HxsB [Actinoplanes sp. L3-i22]|uniref:His-Xaa-Ser system radical SAM maturase HxsB n=1 Tax=Actinoplanes sp. L3-i22 TaxID=2836373 RepID=UPI001C746812|nr:His-Xaa-Ser system radical SAM maturase HxsB [Actinoplanes sp. L3-i22]BCY09924.1 His-Xaa-Ser system radical SAM maturase HxsB [Actinoplanes sp. L3-i22]